MDRVAGFTSTGSKRREALFGEDPGDAPHRMSRAAGCRVWDDRGREYLDYIMLWAAAADGALPPEACDDPWGPALPEIERAAVDAMVRSARAARA